MVNQEITLQQLSVTRDPQSFFFFSFETQAKFGWTSIKCFHDNSPVHLAAVEFVMETFEIDVYPNLVPQNGKSRCGALVTGNRCSKKSV